MAIGSKELFYAYQKSTSTTKAQPVCTCSKINITPLYMMLIAALKGRENTEK